MSPLGRGLASLIPRRSADDAEEALDHIDSVEEVEESAPPANVIRPLSPVKAEEKEEVPAEAPEEVEAPDETPVEQEVEEIGTEEPEVSEDPQPESESDEDTETLPGAEAADEVRSDASEFEELDREESAPMPEKPLVTPLTIDPETGALTEVVQASGGMAAQAAHTRTEKSQVEATTEEPDMTAEHVEEEVAAVEQATEPAAAAPAEEKVTAQAEPVIQKSRAEKPKLVEDDSALWESHEEAVQQVPLSEISVNPLQPRRVFDEQELGELKDSLAQHGMLQPIVVIRQEGGYELLAGERRLRAATQLGWEKVPAVVKLGVGQTGGNRLELALIENIQREDLNPVEVAQAYQRLNEEFGMTHEEIGQRLGTSRVAITNTLRLLQLPKQIQDGLIEGKISVGHARAILMIPDEQKQLTFYQHMLDEGLTVRKAENRARRIQRNMKLNDPLRKRTRGRPALAVKYDGQLEEKYGHNARVKFNSTKNRFEVFFYAFNEQEAEDLIGRLLDTSQVAEYPDDE